VDIPNTELAEIAIAIFSFLGVVLITLFKIAIDELRILHKSIDEVSKHLSHAKEDIFKIAATVAACKSCPHPNIDKLVSTEEEEPA
jgi:hypothetical protein